MKLYSPQPTLNLRLSVRGIDGGLGLRAMVRIHFAMLRVPKRALVSPHESMENGRGRYFFLRRLMIWGDLDSCRSLTPSENWRGSELPVGPTASCFERVP